MHPKVSYPITQFIEASLSNLSCSEQYLLEEETACGLGNRKNETLYWELLITYCASRIGSCGAQRTLRTHPLLKSAAGRSLRLLEVPIFIYPNIYALFQAKNLLKPHKY